MNNSKKREGIKNMNLNDFNGKIIVYDLETSGIDPAFTSILQAAAICYDQNFRELDRFDLRGRCKREFPIAFPQALMVNGVTVDQLRDHENSNYKLISLIRQKFMSWGEAVYLGFNSFRFDELHLRNSFYQSALPSYLTNTNGNRRGDVLKLLHTSAAISPNTFVRPISDETGKITFQLEKVASANNISQEVAHDALYDCLATAEICKIIKEKIPQVWSRSINLAFKQNVYDLLDQEKIFCASRFYKGREITHGISYITKNPVYPNHIYCFDLKHDPEIIFNLDRSQLKELFQGKGRAFHIIAANEQPILLDQDILFQTKEYKDENPETIFERMKKMRSNKQFIERFENLLIDMQEERSFSQDQSEKLVEKQIYDGFASSKDSHLMEHFHAALPDQKYEIILKISDHRYQEFCKRVMYNEFHEYLPKKESEKRDRIVAENHLTLKKQPWCTIPQAQKQIDDLREQGDEKIDFEKLQEIDTYLSEMQEKFENVLKK